LVATCSASNTTALAVVLAVPAGLSLTATIRLSAGELRLPHPAPRRSSSPLRCWRPPWRSGRACPYQSLRRSRGRSS
jgi:hypothetical protein